MAACGQQEREGRGDREGSREHKGRGGMGQQKRECSRSMRAVGV